MSDSPMITPSELVLLNGEKFARPSRFGTKLMHLDAEVSTRELGRAMLAAALLTNEKLGAIQLELRTESVLFGLFRTHALYVQPGSQVSAWPEGTLEAYIPFRASVLAAQHKNRVQYVLYDWLGRDFSEPWAAVVAMIENQLARRGLIEVTTRKVLRIFNQSDVALLPGTADLAERHPVEDLLNQCAACRSERELLWSRLIHEINRAVFAREQDDSVAID